MKNARNICWVLLSTAGAETIQIHPIKMETLLEIVMTVTKSVPDNLVCWNRHKQTCKSVTWITSSTNKKKACWFLRLEVSYQWIMLQSFDRKLWLAINVCQMIMLLMNKHHFSSVTPFAIKVYDYSRV